MDDTLQRLRDSLPATPDSELAFSETEEGAAALYERRISDVSARAESAVSPSDSQAVEAVDVPERTVATETSQEEVDGVPNLVQPEPEAEVVHGLPAQAFDSSDDASPADPQQEQGSPEASVSDVYLDSGADASVTNSVSQPGEDASLPPVFIDGGSPDASISQYEHSAGQDAEPAAPVYEPGTEVIESQVGSGHETMIVPDSIGVPAFSEMLKTLDTQTVHPVSHAGDYSPASDIEDLRVDEENPSVEHAERMLDRSSSDAARRIRE